MNSGKVFDLFEELCLGLNLDDKTRAEAKAMMEMFCGSQSSTAVCLDYEHLWPACAIYCSPKVGVTLSQLLTLCNKSRVYDFLKPLQLFITTCQLKPFIYERLHNKYVIATLLYEKYIHLYSRHFKIDLEATIQIHSPRKVDPTVKIFKFGWYLFLLAKGKLLADSDYVQCLHLMLCSINLLNTHMPDSYRKISLQQISKESPLLLLLPPPPLLPHHDGDLLFYWASENFANFPQLKDMQDRIFLAWIKTLCDNTILKYQPAKVPSEACLVNSFYLGGLLDTCLDENERSLCKEYDVLLHDTCDFDERLFLENSDQVQSPKRPQVASSLVPIYSGGTGVGGGVVGSSRGNVPMTPAKAAMHANDWLITTLGSLDDEPSPSLKKFLVYEEDDLTDLVKRRLQLAVDLINFTVENEERKKMIKKLYYRILEAILNTESKRISSIKDIRPLIRQDLFNNSLLAGVIEIVICSYRCSFVQFPWILQKMCILPFDFYTIIECIIVHEPQLPYSVRKHLIRIEERVLEEMGWESNSPIYLGLTATQRELLLERLKMINGTPKKISQKACQNFASPVKVPLNGKINKKVELFMRKVAHLGALRIKEFVSVLEGDIEIPPPVVQLIEYTFVHIITQTTLPVDRHIDQLIMCILYGICKIRRIPLTFKQIVEKYQTQPQSNPQTYRVVKRSNSKIGDIIVFYNNDFLQCIQSFLLEFLDPEAQVESSPVNLRVQSPFKLQKSPQKINNLTISPRRTPLLLKDIRFTGNSSVTIGTLKSPQSDFDKINRSINKNTMTLGGGLVKAKRKLFSGGGEEDNSKFIDGKQHLGALGPSFTGTGSAFNSLHFKDNPFLTHNLDELKYSSSDFESDRQVENKTPSYDDNQKDSDPLDSDTDDESSDASKNDDWKEGGDGSPSLPPPPFDKEEGTFDTIIGTTGSTDYLDRDAVPPRKRKEEDDPTTAAINKRKRTDGKNERKKKRTAVGTLLGSDTAESDATTATAGTGATACDSHENGSPI